VSEFIIDFINQAKENIPVLKKAYDEKDMDKIQKTAHMLKGASSNLRIAPMADTLYHLQFNDTLEKVPELIRLFTGQLKALSIQMDQE
jgi:HPt (histidine-containing phosphotransfer) domain-containing protein